MLSKSGEIPEFAERSPSNFLSSSLRQDHEVPRRPQVPRASSPHARADFDGTRSSRKPGAYEFPEIPPQDDVAITISGTRSSRKPGAYEFPEIPPQDDVAITISVIEGPSKGLTYQLSKLCITMGRIGGGADFEFDEPQASDVHCVIAARQGGVRLYVAPSMNNLNVNDQRIYTVELVHMSTFRVGSSLLLVSVLPTQCADVG